jgi:unsaturated rhamnogalacturonyl hydrolase
VIRTSRRAFGALLGASVVVSGLTTAVVAQAADTSCQVQYVVSSQWSGGFTAAVTITNAGAAVDGWQLSWSFPSGQQLVQAWNASAAQAGANVTVTNASWNAAVPTGGSVSFGFNGSWTATNAAPTGFTFNGAACSDSAPTPTSPGTSASPSQSAAPTSSPTASPSATTATDWSTAMVDSTMARSDADIMSTWDYTRALYLYGQYLVYKRTGQAAYLDYVRRYADQYVDNAGNLSVGLDSLDNMLGGNLFVLLYQETGDQRYRIAAQHIRTRLDTYPRTSDGGFWHNTWLNNQLWADGVFMVNPFLARYGAAIADSTYAFDETTKQLTVYYSHLQRSNGLLWHAYDGNRTQGWANPTTGNSPESWCRAIGWFGMATVDVLDVLPTTHPQRAALVTIVQNLAQAFATYQDPATGRWFQVVDKGTVAGNWTETSCSSMYTYVLSRGVEKGYLDASYRAVAAKGYAGVLAKISLDSSGYTTLVDVVTGTGPGDYNYYINQWRPTNDLHGLGAFLIMNEQMIRTAGVAG